MNTQDKLSVKLLDGTIVSVGDCEADLLVRFLQKHNFDMQRVKEEIGGLCNGANDVTTIRELLNQSLTKLTVEIASSLLKNPIVGSRNQKVKKPENETPWETESFRLSENAESIQKTPEGLFQQTARQIQKNTGIPTPDKQKHADSHGTNPRRVQFTVAETAQDLRKVLRLRKEIFMDEEGYPFSAIKNSFERESLHIIATINDSPVGVVTVTFNSSRGLPLEKYINLDNYKDKKIVEMDKLAVLNNQRKKEVSFQLMWLCYSIARFWGAERIVIFTLAQKKGNLAIYRRFGFKELEEFDLFPGGKATALILDFGDVSTYEKHLNTRELLRLGRKLLNKFSLRKT